MNTAFGSLPHALKLLDYRSTVLGNNLVNQSTPGFQARDFDFETALKNVSGLPVNQLKADAIDLQYRIPSSPALDGNTVDSAVEKAKYAENSVRYLAALNFLSRKVDDLMTAIKGGTSA